MWVCDVHGNQFKCSTSLNLTYTDQSAMVSSSLNWYQPDGLNLMHYSILTDFFSFFLTLFAFYIFSTSNDLKKEQFDLYH